MNKNDPIKINIAREFTTTPGPREPAEGEFSGEMFLRELLRPRFETARGKNVPLLVELDGTEGYATSFLEAAFGGLARVFGSNEVLKRLQFLSEEEPLIIDEIREYITDVGNPPT